MADIFRKKALERLSNPDQLDRTMKITSPLSLLILIGIAAIVAGCIVWGFLGRLVNTQTATGIITGVENSGTVFSDYTGSVAEIKAAQGEKIKKGDVVAVVTDGSEMKEITSGYDGTVSAVLTDKGESVYEGGEIARIKPATDTDKILVCYVPLATAGKIKEGQEAIVSPVNTDSQKTGNMKAIVIGVGKYPANVQNMAFVLGADNGLSDSFLSEGPVTEIICSLEADTSSQNGFYWTSENGKKSVVNKGTLANVSIITDKEAPIKKLFSTGN